MSRILIILIAIITKIDQAKDQEELLRRIGEMDGENQELLVEVNRLKEVNNFLNFFFLNFLICLNFLNFLNCLS